MTHSSTPSIMRAAGKVLLNQDTKFFTLNGQILRGWKVDGQIWFSGVDVMDATGLAHLTRRTSSDHERRMLLETSGGHHESRVITAFGLLEIAFRVKTPPALMSQRQFCEEALRLYASAHA